MSGKVFSRVRGGGFFKRADIVVYALIAVVAIVLLLVFLLPSDGGLSGFEITYDGATVLTYDFDDGLTVKDAFRDAVVTTEGDGGLYLTVTTADGVNTCFVDLGERSVKMTDADCSVSKDCTYMPALDGGDGAIICVPNRIRIVPVGGISAPVTG